MRSSEPILVGIFWYRNAEEFQRLRSMSADDATLPDSYDRWLRAAESAIENLKSGRCGVKAVRVDVDTDEFLSWCAARHLKLNAASRMAFANQKVYFKVRG